MGYADQPRYSPNGKFFWDGRRWTPVEDRLWDVRLADEDAEPAHATGPEACDRCGAVPGKVTPHGTGVVRHLVALALGLSFTLAGVVGYLATAP